MPAISDTVLVRSWPVDTGCPTNLIDEGDATPFAQFIELGDAVALATASGQLRIERRLELHIDELE